jgi:cytochrome c oxidase subunit 2
MKHLIWPAVLFLHACAGPRQSSVDAAGAHAAAIERLWWFFFWLLLAIFVIVMAIAGGSIARRQGSAERIMPPSPETEKRLGWSTGAATIATTVILLVLIVMSISTANTATGPGAKSALTVEVQGNQWWWYIRYLNDDASQIVVTAHEIHIPVGTPVMIRGTSNDVIHSFWVPNLQGKRDLIPSRVTTEQIYADRPGRYRGQCAEFCGLQHAHMAFWVVAEPRDKFEQWMNAQRQPAMQPSSAANERGMQVFLNHACVLCHNITGSTASGQVGPDLTHFGSRLTVAAGTLANNRVNLGRWISDPQTIKPGNHMATVPIPPEDLQPLIEYLESLK